MDTRGSGRRIVDGRFELLGRLGSGGMGTVWRARDIVLHREVALKEVRPSDTALEDADPARARMLSERVLREARAMARIAHPNVVTIHHIVDSSEGPHPWIVMELVQGQSLHERLAQGPLTVTEALRVGRGVLSALRTAHDAGIQHRDVKPANVLLRPDGSPVLTDFGIAALRESTSLTATGDLIGSPEYIAPERIRGEEGNPASDLWSLGMLLYVSLEGSHPLRRDTSLSTLVAVLDEPIPAPVRSAALTPVLNALLVRDAAARPDGAQLERMLDDAARNSLGSPSGSPTQPWSPAPPYAPHPGATAGNVYGTTAVQPPPGHFGMAPSGTRPHRQWRKAPAAVGVAAALAVASVIVLNLLPDHGGTTGGNRAGASSSADGASAGQDGRKAQGDTANEGSGSGTGQPAEVALPPSKETKHLLTPDGVRTVVKAFQAKTGTTKFVELTVYEEYAIASVPVPGSRAKYDRYTYRNGYASKEGPGGSLTSMDEGPIDVSKVKWAVLPALIKKADQVLGVPKPTMRYVIVRGSVFESVPTVNVYVSDEYGASGYLAADFDGAVVNTVEAAS
ncbi:serine/threonine-protein kinase [Streptomyces sp. NPDC057445]|uniref:serine/threonine-protein kinase n=1 Tax=Streptomyces sp. NPDC057445 TaxID=3346136 RepID=UPI0036A64A02